MSKLIALRRQTKFRTAEWSRLTSLIAWASRHAEYNWQRAYD